MPKKSNLNSIKSKSKHKKPNKASDKSDEKQSSTEKNKEDKKSMDKNKENTIIVTVSPQPNETSDEQSKGVSSDKPMEESTASPNVAEVKEQNEGEVVLRLNPDGGDVDELLQENVVNDIAKKQIKDEKTVKKAKVVPFKRELITPEDVAKKQKNVNPEEEDEEEDTYDPNKPVVASVVLVTQRKSSVPIEMYANKKLLLKAVKDATDSTQGKRKRHSDEVDYTPTPIKKRLGERQDLTKEAEQLDPQDLRNYLKVNKKGIFNFA